MDQAVAELLEQAQKKADAAVAKAANNYDDDESSAGSGDEICIRVHPNRRRNTSSDAGVPPSSDPRRKGRAADKYSAEREQNNDRRERRNLDGDTEMTDARPSSSGNGSANGSLRSSRDHGRRHRTRSPDRDRRRGSRDDRHDGYRERGPLGPDRRDPRNRQRLFDRGDEDGEDDRYYRPTGARRPPPPRDEDRGYRGGGDRGRRDDADRGHRAYSPRDGNRGDRRSSPRREIRDRRKPRTPEPTDDERDRRTVFVQQLAARLRTKELQTFFEQVGPVVEAQIVKDRVSHRSKGVGYVEFREEDSVKKAIELTGQKLLGIPIIAQLTEAEKNRQARVPKDGSDGPTATQSNGVPFHRLYVGNIHFSITEEDLRQVFEPFGELEFVQLQKEGMDGIPHGPGNMHPGSHGGLGRSKGYGFVQFVDPTQAKEALERMNGFELAGRPIRVGLGNDKFTPESTQSLLNRFGSQQARDAHAANGPQAGSSFSGMGGRGAHAGGTGNFDRASGRDAQEKQGGGASALDDTDVAGVNFSNYSRDALMRKLARTDEPDEAAEKKATAAAAVPQKKKAPPAEHTKASRCVILKNMYNQADETERGWQKELEEDVKIECEDKYGHVVHIGLALDNNDGEIYIKFDRTQGGENAIRGLNGRYFGGRMITAQYVVDAVYHMNFPKAANV